MKKLLIVVGIIVIAGCFHLIFSHKSLGDPKQYEGLSTVDMGKLAFENLKCTGCHSVDGSEKPGGSFKGIFNKEVELVDGKKIVRNEAYLTESILEPQAKVVKGRLGSMISFKPHFKGRDKELKAIVAYIISLTPQETKGKAKDKKDTETNKKKK